MSLHHDDWLHILDELRKDLPWLLQLWRDFRKSIDGPIGSVTSIDLGDGQHDVTIVGESPDGNTVVQHSLITK